MTAPIIQPVAQTIEDILQGPGFYRIPRFQRPFSWTTEHVDEFWNEAMEQGENGYFIGPMVVYKKGSELGIVDGQQRLTTITLILAAIRDQFEALGAHSLADGTHRYIERPDRNNEQRFVLQSDVDDTTWIHEAQLRTAQRSSPAPKPPLIAARAIDLLRDRIRTVVETAAASVPKSRASTKVIETLKKLRDKLLSVQVIWIPLPNEDDAYTIFETLNSRGRDLETADLLRNFFLEALRGKNANVDVYRQRWNKVQSSYEQTQGAELRKFILHWWISENAYTAERRVFRDIRRHVPKKDAKAKFDDFERDSVTYRTLVDPDNQPWRLEQFALRDSLVALRTMRIEQPLPLFLSLMRACQLKLITIKQLRTQLELVENYHFQVTAVLARSSSGGVSKSYASLARRLSQAATAAERQAVLADIGKTLRSRKPEREDFLEAFASRFWLTDEAARDKKLVQYTLRKIHSVERPHPSLDFTKCSIEHLLPQSKAKPKSKSDDSTIVGNIGNLLLIDDSLQNYLADKHFSSKQRLLAFHKATYPVDDILAASAWGESEIRARARRLATVAYDRVWKL